jgi:type I restriction enzyme R subunit
MVDYRGHETLFELTTIERLGKLRYRYRNGKEIDRPLDEVVLAESLRAELAHRYSDLPPAAINLAVKTITRPEGADTLRRNMDFHIRLAKGFELLVEWPDGRREHRHIYPIDWSDPENNDFCVVNQLPIHGQNDRRPDILVYVNGLPLVLFELKNPYSEKPTVEEAFN